MNNKMLLIDTETGGLDASSHSILSLAALVVDYAGRTIDEMYTLIDEGENVITEDSALAINGLSMVTIQQRGVSPIRAVGLLYEMLNRHNMLHNVTVVAHSVKFDFPFLRRLFREAGINDTCFNDVFSHRTICTQAGAGLLMQAGVINPTSTSLANLCEYFKIPLNRTKGHNALEDARATAAVFECLLQRCQEGL
jgi:DNA polymerase III epsilon subunit-like protein